MLYSDHWRKLVILCKLNPKPTRSVSMRTIVLSLVLAASAVFGSAALAQQQTAPTTAAASADALLVMWKGVWNSNTSAATGDLTIQVTSVADNKVTGKLAMTRPQNNTPRWSCIDTPIDFVGEKQGEQITLAVDFKGGCNKNEFTFGVKDGKLQGVYKTQSGSSGTYTLTRQDQVAAAK